jgi:hypothetical protein
MEQNKNEEYFLLISNQYEDIISIKSSKTKIHNSSNQNKQEQFTHIKKDISKIYYKILTIFVFCSI